MFSEANKSVCILSHELNARVYGREEIIEQAKLFLAEPTHSALILVENSSEQKRDGHPFFEELGEYENIQWRILPKPASDHLDFHMLVMDDDSYRFEADKSTPNAIAAFGDREVACHLKGLFEEMWEQSEPLSVDQSSRECSRKFRAQ